MNLLSIVTYERKSVQPVWGSTMQKTGHSPFPITLATMSYHNCSKRGAKNNTDYSALNRRPARRRRHDNCPIHPHQHYTKLLPRRPSPQTNDADSGQTVCYWFTLCWHSVTLWYAAMSYVYYDLHQIVTKYGIVLLRRTNCGGFLLTRSFLMRV